MPIHSELFDGYTTGTASNSASSGTVTGSGTSWLSEATVGGSFMYQGETTVYHITDINSDTEIVVTPSISSSHSGANYIISNYKLSNGLIEDGSFKIDDGISGIATATAVKALNPDGNKVSSAILTDIVTAFGFVGIDTQTGSLAVFTARSSNPGWASASGRIVTAVVTPPAIANANFQQGSLNNFSFWGKTFSNNPSGNNTINETADGDGDSRAAEAKHNDEGTCELKSSSTYDSKAISKLKVRAKGVTLEDGGQIKLRFNSTGIHPVNELSTTSYQDRLADLTVYNRYTFPSHFVELILEDLADGLGSGSVKFDNVSFIGDQDITARLQRDIIAVNHSPPDIEITYDYTRENEGGYAQVELLVTRNDRNYFIIDTINANTTGRVATHTFNAANETDGNDDYTDTARTADPDKKSIAYIFRYRPPTVGNNETDVEQITLDNITTAIKPVYEFYISRNKRHYFKVTEDVSHSFSSDDENDTDADYVDTDETADPDTDDLRTRVVIDPGV